MMHQDSLEPAAIRIKCIFFRIRRICAEICHGYNDCKKLTTCHKVNDFCHGGCHFGQ